ncbi:MAG TPA: helix-turn-helix domain-containing protein [Allosphingosinicella sp.]|nr:helix-turn-helix domain-containing protein [Allosphingosinicella sp.]
MEQKQNPESPATPIGAPVDGSAPAETGFYYRNGEPIPPTHPDHGPMHLLPRQEDGSFAAYYYCSHEELAVAQVPAPPPRRHRRDGFSAERQQAFVEHYRDTGSLTDAARLTGISRSTAYNLLNSPDGAAFRAAIEEAGRGADVILEATAMERAVHGQEEIVYYQGRRVGVRWKYDNRLLMSLLRARNPLKYAPLSEIKGWLARRGIAPPADVEGALDRLAAAEAEWGRRLPGEPDATARPALAAIPPATQFAQASNLSISGPETPVQASTSSTLPAEAPAAPAPGGAASVYRPPPRARIRLA